MQTRGARTEMTRVASSENGGRKHREEGRLGLELVKRGAQAIEAEPERISRSPLTAAALLGRIDAGSALRRLRGMEGDHAIDRAEPDADGDGGRLCRSPQHTRPGPLPGRCQVSPRRFRLLFRTAGCVAAVLCLGMAQPGSAQAPSGEVTVSFHVTPTPSWPKEPWPDFMTFYGTTATAAGIVLPRKYFEQVAVHYSNGSYACGGDSDLDELFLQQGRERDPAKREALLHRIQQATVDRVMFAPLMNLRGLIAIGPRPADHAMNVIPRCPFPACEDMRLESP